MPYIVPGTTEPMGVRHTVTIFTRVLNVIADADTNKLKSIKMVMVG